MGLRPSQNKRPEGAAMTYLRRRSLVELQGGHHFGQGDGDFGQPIVEQAQGASGFIVIVAPINRNGQPFQIAHGYRIAGWLGSILRSCYRGQDAVSQK